MCCQNAKSTYTDRQMVNNVDLRPDHLDSNVGVPFPDCVPLTESLKYSVLQFAPLLMRIGVIPILQEWGLNALHGQSI